MENKNRLVISLIILVVSFSILSSSLKVNVALEIIILFLFLLIAVWSFVEGIIFVKRKENRDALPLVLMALYVAFYGLFVGIGGIMTTIFNLVESGVFQLIGFFLFFGAIIIYPVLGIWAVVKGINLIRSKENVKLGVISLIIGAVVLISTLLLFFEIFI